ncbi:hypothetical protein CASFOL_041089 [Castilleja foliolosa]|uniref:Peptidase A1 domain-containing protein n=1 Tax=Castilleja foliolosa TaxID=1961234 RepID=A0ABD3BDF6_9LAMI
MFPFRQTFVIILIIHLSLFINSASARSAPHPSPPTLITKLVHYLSLESPFYDDFANKSARDISFFDLQNSISRASHLTTLNYTLFDDKNTIEAPLEPRPLSGGFLASIQVGSKLLDQFVYMDTGSGLFWINCEPCGNLDVQLPLFHPLESTTFRKENCSLGFCAKTGAVTVKCDDKGTCSYTVRYAGDSYSKGYLARDSIKFGGSEEILPHVAFGCSRAASGLKVNGILGLSNNQISLISQLQSSRFAYCIGNISDTSYPYSVLAIGDKIDLLGKQTTLIVEDKYYLTLEAIKFGGKALDIDASIFQRNPSEYTGGMIVDTGSTYTFIPKVVVDKIDAEIIALIGPRLPRNHNNMYKGHPMLCFDGLLTRDLDRWFPIVAFKFSGNDADMELSYENMFRQMDDKSFCSVVIPSEVVAGPTTTLSILGNMMQQYYFIRFDLSEKIFSFERMECDYLQN